MVYVCSGTRVQDNQYCRTRADELRNAVYAGPWVSNAKRYFSKHGCAAHQIGNDYMKGSAIRQDYLETAIRWISRDAIEDYMGRHQNDDTAAPLWEYFQSVIQ